MAIKAGSIRSARGSVRIRRVKRAMRVKRGAGRRPARKRRASTRRLAYRLGWEQGYHLGRCRVVVNQANTAKELPIYPLRLMYVTSGLGVPYAPLDEVISAALGEQVAVITTVRPQDDVLRIAQEFKPDAMIVLDGVQMISAEVVEQLRINGIRTAAWFVDDPYYTDLTVDMAFHYDIVFTIELSCYELYRDLGHQHVHYMPLGVEPSHFQPMPVGPQYQSDICFIGTAFWNRVHFFDAVLPHLRGRKLRVIGLWWNRMRHYRKMKSVISLNRWLSPEETAKYYNGAKIVVNLHRSSDDMTYNRNSRGIQALSINPRTFEISASGAFQLSDIRQDMHRFLQPGKEIETFSSMPEFLDKVNFYLANSEARQQIALSGLKRTIEDHTFRRRAAEMLRIIAESLT